jgi:hypothetical protein
MRLSKHIGLEGAWNMRAGAVDFRIHSKQRARPESGARISTCQLARDFFKISN